MSNEKVICTVEDIDSAMDRDVVLSSYAMALQESTLYGAVLYNMKYAIYKLQIDNDVVIRAMSPDYVVEHYNLAYNDALKIKESQP